MAAEIGILAGTEGPFPQKLIEKINEMNVDGIRAEMCVVTEANMDIPSHTRSLLTEFPM